LWVECPPSSRDSEQPPACRQPRGWAALDVSIVPRAVAALPNFSNTVLGFTPMAKDGERDSLADVFYDRVKAQAEAQHHSRQLILGHAMAHEIGHLLLRTNGHSSQGIMRARWTPEDLHRAAWGQLVFTREQAALMRAEVLARTGHPGGTPNGRAPDRPQPRAQ